MIYTIETEVVYPRRCAAVDIVWKMLSKLDGDTSLQQVALAGLRPRCRARRSKALKLLLLLPEYVDHSKFASQWPHVWQDSLSPAIVLRAFPS